MYEKFIQNIQYAKYLLQIYNVNSLLSQLSCAPELQSFIFCYFLLQNPCYKDSFFCIKNLQRKKIRSGTQSYL
ncbi:low affinity Fe/Cu permease [Bacillus mycoides]